MAKKINGSDHGNSLMKELKINVSVKKIHWISEY